MMVQTVTGKIDVQEIHHTQCHEHLFIAKGKSYEINPVLCIDDYEKVVSELKDYKKFSGSLIVDAQPVGCGRMAKKLAEASKESDVYIVASTGFHKLIFYEENHWIHTIDPKDYKDLLVSEITQGMYIDADKWLPKKIITARAGIVKVALDKEGLSPRYQILMDAAIEAAKYTGVSIQCHIELAEHGPIITRYFIENGLEKDQIIIAHMDREMKSKPYILETAAEGVFMEFDTIGRFKYHSNEEEVELIQMLCEAGYSEQVLISLDTTRARLKSYGSDIGLTHILKEFIPLLKKYGFNQLMINKMTIDNPRRALAMR